MSLTTISATPSLGHQPSSHSNYQSSYTNNNSGASTLEKEALLSAEQKNSFQDEFDAKLAEQVENIKSNYQSAKDLDLMQAYYQQQQKLIDIYMQTSTDNDAYSNNDSNTSAVNTLTNAYVSLYELHNNIKDGVQQRPNAPDDINAPVGMPEILPMNDNMSLAKKQTDVYNSLMMPSSASYLHLSA